MKTNNKAFTVIEAVIVFAIVAVIVSLGLVLYNKLTSNDASKSAAGDSVVIKTDIPSVVDSKGLEAVDTTLSTSGLDTLDDFSDLDTQLSQF